MSKQLYFFHSEPDISQLLQEMERFGGLLLVDGVPVPPTSCLDAVLEKMSTFSCTFQILPAALARDSQPPFPREMLIEFKNCCKGNALSRTYEVGRFYMAPGGYVPETAALYDALAKYIRTAYSYKKAAGAWFSPDFLEKYNARLYHALRAGKPVLKQTAPRR